MRIHKLIDFQIIITPLWLLTMNLVMPHIWYPFVSPHIYFEAISHRLHGALLHNPFCITNTGSSVKHLGSISSPKIVTWARRRGSYHSSLYLAQTKYFMHSFGIINVSLFKYGISAQEREQTLSVAAYILKKITSFAQESAKWTYSNSNVFFQWN